MPIPKPHKGEKQTDFISRCMGSDTMNKEYPDSKQRSGVCYTAWQGKSKSNMKLNTISFKLNKLQTKIIDFEGKPHLVAPTVILVEGVHTGATGISVLYTREELKKAPHKWNGMPVPIYHPQITDDSGESFFVSANDPEILEQYNSGRIFHVEYVEENNLGKLKGELYIDVEKANKLYPGIVGYIQAGKQLEVSTGLFDDSIQSPGEWNDEHYDVIASNIRPDHLALLPGLEGACSWQDGCGVRVNQKKGDDRMKDNFVTETIKNLANYMGLKVSENNDISTTGGEKIEDNEKIKDNIPPNNQKQDQDIDNANQAKDDKLNKKGDDNMKEKKDRVDALITNKATPYEEEHREFLMGLEDCPLSKIEALAAKAQKADELEVNFNAEKEKADKLQQQIEANKKTDPPAKTDPPPKAQTPEQYIANAPPEMQEVLRDGYNLRQEKRKNLINAIMANENNRFTEDGLKAMDMGTMENIAAMVNIPKANYAGQGGGPKTQQNADIPSLEVLSCFPDNGGSK